MNQETTQESTYKKEIVSEINDTIELLDGIFLINIILIDHYHHKDPFLKVKCYMVNYHKGSFHGGSSIDFNLIMCEDIICIPSILQIYILCWYHTHILRLRMDITKKIICQYLYSPVIRKSVWKEVTNFDSCQRTKGTNKNMVNYQLRKLNK